MRQLAQVAGKLVQALIELFQSLAERISALWAALAFAKDCMEHCVEYINKARALCGTAKDRSLALIEESRDIKDTLAAVGDINMSSSRAVQELTSGGKIQNAIDLAKSMDDLVLECSAKTTSMVDRVGEGFASIPEILTQGMEPSTSGQKEEDPEPVDVQGDIEELERAQQAVASANVVSAARAGMAGFSSVSSKATSCGELLQVVQSFAVDSIATIESFLGTWDLEAATRKILEMCRLVSLGNLIKHFASQIKRLAIAMIDLMKASAVKLGSLDLGDLGGAVEDVKDKLEDTMDDVKDNVEDRLEQVNDRLDDLKDGAVDALKDKFKKFW